MSHDLYFVVFPAPLVYIIIRNCDSDIRFCKQKKTDNATQCVLRKKEQVIHTTFAVDIKCSLSYAHQLLILNMKK